MPSHQLHIAPQQANFSNSEAEQTLSLEKIKQYKKICQFPPHTATLHTASVPKTRVCIPWGFFLRPWFLNTMSPVQQQYHSKGILIPSTPTYAVNLQCSFPLPPTAMTVRLFVGTHSLSDHEITLLQNSFLFLVFLSYCCSLNPLRIQYLAHLLLILQFPHLLSAGDFPHTLKFREIAIGQAASSWIKYFWSKLPN